MLNTIVTIILFIISFGALICIHELGHLSMAKLFNVYCKEYSIGFGPAIFSRKKEGRETTFSIRAIPFGGYVSMYGEGAEDDPDFKDIPHERSIEGIKKWKKAIILSAGVILNAVLAFILIFISNFAFPVISFTRTAIVEDNSIVAVAGVKSGDTLNYIYPEECESDDSIAPFYYEYSDESKTYHAGNFFIVDTNINDVSVKSGENFVLAFMASGDKKNPVFSDGLMLFEAVSKEKLSELKYDTDAKQLFLEWSKKDGSPDYYPNFEAGTFVSDNDFTFTAHLKFSEYEETKNIEIPVKSSKKAAKVINTFDNVGLSFENYKRYLSVGTRFKNTFKEYGSAATAVFKGLKILFTGGIKNMSGIIGIYDMSASLYANYTFATYLFFWGLISVNLAIFNLLPFPGLDGWQLLVTAIEGISKKKIPAKAKTIMSIVGLVLVFGLMLFIVVMDILRIIGI